MVPDPTDEHKPEITPVVPPPPHHDQALVSLLHPDGPAACCPTCGRPYALFSLRASGVLDALHLARDVVSDAIALVEEETLP
jgi:hypothetical protein